MVFAMRPENIAISSLKTQQQIDEKDHKFNMVINKCRLIE